MVRLSSQLRPLYPYLKTVYTHATRAVAPVSIRVSQLHGGWLPTGVVLTMEEAAATSGGRFVEVRPEEVVERRIPQGVPPDHPVFPLNLTERVPRVAVVELPGGRVLGPQNAVITGNGDLLQELSLYFGNTTARQHPLFLHPFPPPPMEVEGRLGLLAIQGDANYYHFLHDVIPRLGVLEACRGEAAPPDRWYVAAATGFQRELLDMVGIAEDRRIDSTSAGHVRADMLVAPSPPAMTVINPPWVGAFLREKLGATRYLRVPGRGVYIARKAGDNNRSVVNEAEVLALVSERGFDVIDPGNMRVAEQIQAFAEASVIVATHGAALANLVFCNQGSSVVELFPAGSMVPDYWKMACGVPGLEYRYLVGLGDVQSRNRPQMLVSDIEVDLKALSATLDDIARRA